jgi:hypothetical protein
VHFWLSWEYISATLVSENINLRKSIYKITKESKLLNLIGQAEMEKEVQKTVKDFRKQPNMNLELDEKELVKYLHNVIKELKSKQKIVDIFIIMFMLIKRI